MSYQLTVCIIIHAHRIIHVCIYCMYNYMYIHVLYTCTCTGMHMYMYMYINYTCTYVHVPDTFWIYWGWWSEPFLASWGGQGTENSPQETRIGPKPCPLKTNHRSTTPTWLLCILYIHTCKASKGTGKFSSWDLFWARTSPLRIH